MRKKWIFLVVCLLLIVAYQMRDRREDVPLPPEEPLPVVVPEEEISRRPAGDAILDGYGSEASSAAGDLQKLGAVVENLLLHFKTLDSRKAGTNEQFAELLRGGNPEKLAFVSATSPIFGDKGLIVDRWGVPLFFHPVAERHIEIRSAGPDGEMFTADDLQRDGNGGFASVEELTAVSVFTAP